VPSTYFTYNFSGNTYDSTNNKLTINNSNTIIENFHTFEIVVGSLLTINQDVTFTNYGDITNNSVVNDSGNTISNSPATITTNTTQGAIWNLYSTASYFTYNGYVRVVSNSSTLIQLETIKDTPAPSWCNEFQNQSNDGTPAVTFINNYVFDFSNCPINNYGEITNYGQINAPVMYNRNSTSTINNTGSIYIA
jgi:hypothetical protein